MALFAAWFAPLVGAVLIALVLRDMFHRLWHPSGQGALSERLIRGVWRLSRKMSRGSSPAKISGPVAVVSVILAWAGLLAVGFALVYWPFMTEEFILGTGLDAEGRSDALDSLYLSMVTLATLGYGDIVPTAGPLRILAPVEAFAGFALFTAAVSWVMQVYPVLGRRRSLALRLAMLDGVEAPQAVSSVDSSSMADLLQSLSADLAHIRVDLHQYSETYYFQETDPRLSLSAQLPQVVALAEAGARSSRADVRFAARLLQTTIDDLAALLTQRFLPVGDPEDTDAVLRAYAEVHGSR